MMDGFLDAGSVALGCLLPLTQINNTVSDCLVFLEARNARVCSGWEEVVEGDSTFEARVTDV